MYGSATFPLFAALARVHFTHLRGSCLVVLTSFLIACNANYKPGERPQVEVEWPAYDPSDLSAELYHPGSVPRFELEISEQNLEELRHRPRTYVRANFVYGTERRDDVGVRLKGDFTFRDIDEKPSFKIKFDKFIDDQLFRGLERMTFNNAIEDQSYIAERLTYHAFRHAGLPAPRANNAVMAINGESYGLYVNVETEDDYFLARWYGDAEGNLYEAAETDFVRGSADLFDLETNEKRDDRTGLRALVEAAGNLSGGEDWQDTIGAHLDTAQFIDFCAMEAIVSHWDGYCFSRSGFKNFRFYDDPDTRRFSFIVSGADVAMKPLLPAALVPAADMQQLPPYSSAGLLLTSCLEDTMCRQRYNAAIDRLLLSFESANLEAQALAMYQQIRTEVIADPRREHSEETFEFVMDEVLVYLRTRAQTLKR